MSQFLKLDDFQIVNVERISDIQLNGKHIIICTIGFFESNLRVNCGSEVAARGLFDEIIQRLNTVQLIACYD